MLPNRNDAARPLLLSHKLALLNLNQETRRGGPQLRRPRYQTPLPDRRRPKTNSRRLRRSIDRNQPRQLRHTTVHSTLRRRGIIARKSPEPRVAQKTPVFRDRPTLRQRPSNGRRRRVIPHRFRPRRQRLDMIGRRLTRRLRARSSPRRRQPHPVPRPHQVTLLPLRRRPRCNARNRRRLPSPEVVPEVATSSRAFHQPVANTALE